MARQNRPDPDAAIPAAVQHVAGGQVITPVWVNKAGGTTYQLADGRFVKWAPRGSGLDLHAEDARLRWVGDYTPVPTVLASGGDGEGDYLVTATLPGRSAVDPFWIARPATAVRAIAVGLRRLHDVLPVDSCPFSWSVEDRIASGKSGTAQGDPPLIDRLVVCHGDPCAPNTLLTDDGEWSAHVDFDALGIADRWADIAVATMSLGWNYGPGWDATFLDAYGVAADPVRTAYYRALWNST